MRSSGTNPRNVPTLLSQGLCGSGSILPPTTVHAESVSTLPGKPTRGQKDEKEKIPTLTSPDADTATPASTIATTVRSATGVSTMTSRPGADSTMGAVAYTATEKRDIIPIQLEQAACTSLQRKPTFPALAQAEITRLWRQISHAERVPSSFVAERAALVAERSVPAVALPPGQATPAPLEALQPTSFNGHRNLYCIAPPLVPVGTNQYNGYRNPYCTTSSSEYVGQLQARVP